MLSRLVALSLSQRLLVLVLTAMLIAAGSFALRDLPIDAFPDVSSTQVKIIMKAPGMTPEEVESRITVVIEQELLGIPNQTVLRSSSKYAIADITVDFADGTDIYWARQQVNERLGNVLKDLPATASGGMAPITTPLGEVFMFTIEGPQSLTEKRTLLDWVIRPQLRAITGVADVNALGGLVKSLEVVPNPAALAARGISLAQLQTALETNNRSDGAGRLNVHEEALLVRASGNLTSIDDVKSVVVHQRSGPRGAGGGTDVVHVGDMAEVRVGSLTRYGAVTKDGQGDAVEGLVLALRGANARALVAQVRDKLTEIEKTLPAGTSIKPFYDRGNLVERAVSTVTKALAEAIVLVLVLLLVFLGNLRAALVVAVILPLSALATFVLMRQFGLSANLMSLGGLAIAIGMLVDAAVVVVENIEAHASADHDEPFKPRAMLIYDAVKEVAVPVTAGIAIIITVFLPLLTLQGLEGKLFTPVALTIVFALAGSLLLSLTVIPVLASLLLGQATHHTPWLVRKLDGLYHRVLTTTLAHTKLVYGGALLLLMVTAAVYPLIGKSFMPNLDEGDIIVQTEKLPSINLDTAATTDVAIQKRLLATVPEITNVVARAGSDELGLDPMGPNDTDTFLVLKPRAEWRSPDKEKLIDAIRQQLVDFPGITFSFTQPIEMRTSEMLSGVRGDLAVKIFGPDTAELDKLANATVTLLQTIPGNEDVQTIKNEGVQYLQVDLNRQAIGRLGLSVEDVQNALKSLVEGRSAGVVIENGRRIPLLVRGPEGLRMSDALFNQLRIPLADGDAVALSSIATLKTQDGPVKVDRENSSRMVVIRANVRGRDLVGFVADAQAAFDQRIKLPAGYRATWGGQFENQQRAAARLSLVVPVALALIFLLLFTTLGSLRQAVLVLANIPFALVGGVLALWVSGEYLSVPASVGFIALMGIAVLNGLVMISTFNQLHQQGMAIAELVVVGARRRLRPVLMTASITGFGLIPLLLATGPGSEIQRPLAIVVVGGLISATLLTLVLLPSLFGRFGIPHIKPAR